MQERALLMLERAFSMLDKAHYKWHNELRVSAS